MGVRTCILIKLPNKSCEIEDFVETRLCKPCVILRSSVQRIKYLVRVYLYGLMQEILPVHKEDKI